MKPLQRMESGPIEKVSWRRQLEVDAEMRKPGNLDVRFEILGYHLLPFCPEGGLAFCGVKLLKIRLVG